MSQPDDDPRQDYDDEFTGTSQTAPPKGKRFLNRPVETGIAFGVAIVLVLAMLQFGVGRVGDAPSRMKSSNNLKQIGLAFHNYADTYGEFPNNTYDLDGKPLLSWRVHILPFIEEERLLHQFKLDEPWDSPNNLPLLQQIPPVYKPPTGRRGVLTYYRGFSNPGAVFEPRVNDYRPRLALASREPFDFKSVGDGLSNTIFVVEAGDAVEWTKPDDLDAGPGKPFPKFGGMRWRSEKFQAVMADGSVRSFPIDIDETKMRALISHSGCELVTPD
jgi:Protein of unknown function (DUF1559)